MPRHLLPDTLGFSSAHQWSGNSSGNPWALVPPTSRLKASLRHFGSISQLSGDTAPAPLTSGPTSALEHPGLHSQPCQELVPPTGRLTLDSDPTATHSRITLLCQQWVGTSSRTPWDIAASSPKTWPHQSEASSLCTRQGLAVNWMRGQSCLLDHPKYSVCHKRRIHIVQRGGTLRTHTSGDSAGMHRVYPTKGHVPDVVKCNQRIYLEIKKAN